MRRDSAIKLFFPQKQNSFMEIKTFQTAQFEPRQTVLFLICFFYHETFIGRPLRSDGRKGGVSNPRPSALEADVHTTVMTMSLDKKTK